MKIVKVSTLDYGQTFLDPASGIHYTVDAIAGPDHILAEGDEGPDMFFPLDYEIQLD